MNNKFIKNKTFFITGGTGTLGKALVSKIKSNGGKVVIFSRDEGKQALFFGQDSEIVRIIGDIRDYDKLNVSIMRSKPDVIIHTAALKRIDDMEFYPDECVKTNIQGSENVAKAAFNNKVNKCILISTDKACQPVNVYGSSKFIAERIFTNYDYFSDHTIFSSVRYGNVLCSRGSFIPLWLSLLNDNKKIKVTSLEMTRFLFTINDAVDTVLGAVKHSEGGEVFIPQIPSYGMNTILQAIEKINTNGKILFDEIGLRPGEKLHEDMLALTELPFTYKVKDVNLLCVRPQYTKRKYKKEWKKYKGTHFNSSLHVSDNVEELVKLINRGTLESE
jgi:UDP-N-acetylglucosamine 4,6-dehydratase|tara:strand:+ start:2376 stop:3371 length:996 start_codon:yes stop_codon:yes gene_type:complete